MLADVHAVGVLQELECIVIGYIQIIGRSQRNQDVIDYVQHLKWIRSR